MTTHSIEFDHGQIKAILDGSKTQFREPITKLFSKRNFGKITELGKSDTPGYDYHFRDSRMLWNDFREKDFFKLSPYQIGDRLWVKEEFAFHTQDEHKLSPFYAANFIGTPYNPEIPHEKGFGVTGWVSADKMREIDSRITLEITSIRAERVRDITSQDATKEGTNEILYRSNDDELKNKTYSDFGYTVHGERYTGAIGAFAAHWNATHGDDAWDRNDWVWVFEFKKVK